MWSAQAQRRERGRHPHSRTIRAPLSLPGVPLPEAAGMVLGPSLAVPKVLRCRRSSISRASVTEPACLDQGNYELPTRHPGPEKEGLDWPGVEAQELTCIGALVRERDCTRLPKPVHSRSRVNSDFGTVSIRKIGTR